jgi:hypothetical protein
MVEEFGNDATLLISSLSGTEYTVPKDLSEVERMKKFMCCILNTHQTLNVPLLLYYRCLFVCWGSMQTFMQTNAICGGLFEW